MSKNKRYLFLSHVPLDSSYGAAQSARLLIQDLAKKEHFDLTVKEILPIRKVLANLIPITRLKSTMVPLPWLNNFDGSLDFKRSISRHIKLSCHNLYSTIVLLFLFKVVWRRTFPDIIHLNSLVLAQVVMCLSKNKNTKIICHVREVPIWHHKTNQLLPYIHKFICIDHQTETQLQAIYQIPAEKTCIIPNPVQSIDTRHTLTLSDPRKVLSFCLVGQIFPHKGHHLVIECFKALDPERFKLTIVGNTENNQFAAELQASTSNHKNIEWSGHIDDAYQRGVYTQFHVLLRADADHRVGRTMYEGLLSGNYLLLPMKQHEVIRDPLLSALNNRIVTYTANDLTDLIRKISSMDDLIESPSHIELNKFVQEFNHKNSQLLDFVHQSCQ